MALYGKLDYWEDRYSHSGDTGAYDWYQTYGDLRHLLTADILKRSFSGICSLQDRPSKDENSFDTNSTFFPSQANCRVLILGSGNSPFGEDMRSDGWTGDIVNVDFSSVVINQMIKKQENTHDQDGKECLAPKMKFICADVTKGLPFDDSSFDLIICKGTFDSILCSNGSVSNIKKLVDECDRVLASAHGCLFLVTYGSPDNRVVFLEHGNDPTYYWEGICVNTVPRKSQTASQNDYVYICRKKRPRISRNNRLSEMTKAVGDENVELSGEQSVHKLVQAGDS